MLRRPILRSAIGMAVLFCVDGCDGSPAVAPDGGLASIDRDIVVSPLPLQPAFSPTIHDYAVHCAAGKNPLTIAVTAQSGSTRLVQPTPTEPAGSQSLELELDEDQAAVVEMGPAGDADRYWIRCLPHDFPVIAATHHDAAVAPSPGWYLVS